MENIENINSLENINSTSKDKECNYSITDASQDLHIILERKYFMSTI